MLHSTLMQETQEFKRKLLKHVQAKIALMTHVGMIYSLCKA